MSELVCLELSVLLWIVHVLCQALTARAEFGDMYLFGPRDEQLVPKGVMCGRATRALHNYVENLVPFVALDVALIATQHTGGLGATIWILGASFISRFISRASPLCVPRYGASRSSVY